MNRYTIGAGTTSASGVGKTTAEVLADAGPYEEGATTFLTDGPDQGAPLRWYPAGPWWGWAAYPSARYGS